MNDPLIALLETFADDQGKIDLPTLKKIFDACNSRDSEALSTLLFDLGDQNKDRNLTQEELTIILKSPFFASFTNNDIMSFEEIFLKLDKDGDGKITLNEFAQVI